MQQSSSSNKPGSAQAEQYITWKEGASILGIKRGSFYYLVESGQVKAEPGRAMGDGRYSLADILSVKQARAEGRPRRAYKKRPAPVDLHWLSPRDIPAILDLDLQVYNELDLASAERYRQWSEKNPELAMCAFERNSNRKTMLAYMACLPLDEQVILSILRREREETSITKEEILTYERPGAYTLLANSAVCLPTHPDLLFRVLNRMVAAWLDRYPERFVTKIYAQSWSERGDMLIQHFFMAPRYDLARNAFMLDLSRPGTSRMIQMFQRALQAKAPLPPELQESYDSEPAVVLTTPPAVATHATAPDGGIVWLEAGLCAWRSFARVHGIPETTVQKAIQSERIPIIKGTWKQGRTTYNEALDQAGRRAFYSQYSSNPRFVACQDCPH